jgi:tRNA G18 (ribose-2'-O)-methylase SpoU
VTAPVVPIDDPADPRVADYVLLTDPELRRRREIEGGDESTGFFIAEGLLVIRQLLSSTYRVRSLLVTPRRYEALEGDLAASGCTAPVFVATQDVVNAVSGFALHRGALAAADRRRLPALGSLVRPGSVLVATEGLNDHENLGALFRNAAAFGAAAILLDPASCDPLYRRAVRVSMGHVLRVPFTRLAALPAGIADLQRLGVEVVALTPAADADDVATVGPSCGIARALLVGAEGPGLSEAALAAADRRVRVPMVAGVDSLNVATAAAIALHRLAGLGG